MLGVVNSLHEAFATREEAEAFVRRHRDHHLGAKQNAARERHRAEGDQASSGPPSISRELRSRHAAAVAEAENAPRVTVPTPLRERHGESVKAAGGASAAREGANAVNSQPEDGASERSEDGSVGGVRPSEGQSESETSDRNGPSGPDPRDAGRKGGGHAYDEGAPAGLAAGASTAASERELDAFHQREGHDLNAEIARLRRKLRDTETEAQKSAKKNREGMERLVRRLTEEHLRDLWTKRFQTTSPFVSELPSSVVRDSSHRAAQRRRRHRWAEGRRRRRAAGRGEKARKGQRRRQTWSRMTRSRASVTQRRGVASPRTVVEASRRTTTLARRQTTEATRARKTIRNQPRRRSRGSIPGAKLARRTPRSWTRPAQSVGGRKDPCDGRGGAKGQRAADGRKQAASVQEDCRLGERSGRKLQGGGLGDKARGREART